MASPSRASKDSKIETKENTRNYDERLDFRSDKFDPLLALNTPGIKLPCTDAKPLDNLSKYISLYVNKISKSGTSAASTSGTLSTDVAFRRKPLEAASGKVQISDRRFLAHQMPIKVEPRLRKTKNVLTQMEKAENEGGYLGALHKCVKENIRVKVITRHAYNVRGYCEGYVIAFDKYWNITLKNVVEVWKTKRPKRAKVLGLTDDILESDQELLKLFPKVTRIKNSRTNVTNHRNVQELMIRGEQIVLINILTD